MGGICNPISKKKTDFQKLRGGNHILNIEVVRSLVEHKFDAPYSILAALSLLFQVNIHIRENTFLLAPNTPTL
jgi:hypothetical protein